MRDFSISAYRKLIQTFLNQDYRLCTFADYLASSKTAANERSNSPVVILRHDIDARPENALEMAGLENHYGVCGSYYFRVNKNCFNGDIIQSIADMGHEIGYHYEDLGQAAKRHKSSPGRKELMDSERILVEEAIIMFEQNLEKLRRLVPVKTICMHGAPLSHWDSRLLWKYYDYGDFGILGEPYFDIDFNEVLYLTDTGRRWNGAKFNIRDRTRVIEGKKEKTMNPAFSEQVYRTTWDIIKAATQQRLPCKTMITFHPQRWTDKRIPWIRELIMQNSKNPVKFLIRKSRIGKSSR